MSESNEEIAALEARLSELKRAKEQKRQESEAAERQIGNSAKAVVSTAAADADTAFDFATLSSRKKVAVVKSATPDEFLSEAWKEQDAELAVGINLGSILAGIALVIGFIAFAQVPIGQNIDQATFGG